MYYNKDFYITKPIWNNALSYENRINKKLYVPSLIKANSLNDIKLWDKIVFEDYDFNWVLQSSKWLKNFYEFDLDIKNKKWNNIKLFLFDNHNHAYYFWHYAKSLWIIENNNLLYHIDEHSDMRDPLKYLWKNPNLKDVFEYTNYYLNVWNYIIPAKKDWLIDEIIQIRNEENLLRLKDKEIINEKWIILNLDLDFFEPELDYIDFNLKKEVIEKIIIKSDLVTVATSSFFIDQKLALEVFKKLFWNII